MIKAYEVVISLYGQKNAVAEFAKQKDALKYKIWLNEKSQDHGIMHAYIEESIIFESFNECN